MSSKLEKSFYQSNKRIAELEVENQKLREALESAQKTFKIIQAEAPISSPSWSAEAAKLGLAKIQTALAKDGSNE